MSPIYPKLKEAGAVFEQVMGYERPTWFEPDLPQGMNIQRSVDTKCFFVFIGC